MDIFHQNSYLYRLFPFSVWKLIKLKGKKININFEFSLKYLYLGKNQPKKYFPYQIPETCSWILPDAWICLFV